MLPTRASAIFGCRLLICITGSGDCRIYSVRRNTIATATTSRRVDCTWMCLPGIIMRSRCRDFPDREGVTDIRLKRLVCAIIFSCWSVLLGSCTPIYLWETHTTSTPRSQSFDAAQVAREPVAVFGLIAPAGLQGFSATLSYALVAALSDASPPVRGIPDYETMNM